MVRLASVRIKTEALEQPITSWKSGYAQNTIGFRHVTMEIKCDVNVITYCELAVVTTCILYICQYLKGGNLLFPQQALLSPCNANRPLINILFEVTSLHIYSAVLFHKVFYFWAGTNPANNLFVNISLNKQNSCNSWYYYFNFNACLVVNPYSTCSTILIIFIGWMVTWKNIWRRYVNQNETNIFPSNIYLKFFLIQYHHMATGT